MALVLLVEDDHAVRTAMTGAMRDAGHVVQPVGTALDALRTVTDDHVDLVAARPGSAGPGRVRGAAAAARGQRRAGDHRDGPQRRADDRAAAQRGRRRLRHQAVLQRAPDRPRRRRAAAGEGRGPRRPTRPSRSASWSSTPPGGRRGLADAPLTLTRREFDLLAYLAARSGQVVSQGGALPRGLAPAEPAPGPDDRRSPVVAAAQARRDRGRTAVPAHRPRRRGQADRPVRDVATGVTG